MEVFAKLTDVDIGQVNEMEMNVRLVRRTELQFYSRPRWVRNEQKNGANALVHSYVHLTASSNVNNSLLNSMKQFKFANT